MSSYIIRPVILAFAGPNGSGKTTVSQSIDKLGIFVNADDIKKEFGLSDMEAAIRAEEIRNQLLDSMQSFSFETVLSTDRNLKLMQKAKIRGFEVQCIYVITASPDINVARVRARVMKGGHDVPVDKIYSRYHRALALLPQVIEVCDKFILFDNSVNAEIIFEKEFERQKSIQMISGLRIWFQSFYINKIISATSKTISQINCF